MATSSVAEIGNSRSANLEKFIFLILILLVGVDAAGGCTATVMRISAVTAIGSTS